MKNLREVNKASAARETAQTPAGQQNLDFKAEHGCGKMLRGQDLKKFVAG